MKRILNTILLSAIFVGRGAFAPASQLPTVALGQDGTNTVVTFNDRVLPDSVLLAVARRMTEVFSSNVTLVVKADASVPSGRLIEILKLLQDAGIRDICLMTRDEDGHGFPTRPLYMPPSHFTSFCIPVRDDPSGCLTNGVEPKGTACNRTNEQPRTSQSTVPATRAGQ